MAWRSHGNTNTELVNNLERNNIFRCARVKSAMLSVDRGDFIAISPYNDSPQSIGYGATISAPHMHAEALQCLSGHLKEGGKVLDVGSGSGYLTVCFAMMVGVTGKVVGIEHMRELVELSKDNVAKHHSDLLRTERVLFVEGDGRQGYPSEAPYDCIHVGAAASEFPETLFDQLAVGGRMVVPVGTYNQQFLQVDRTGPGREDRVVHNLLNVIYVPLTDREHQLTRH